MAGRSTPPPAEQADPGQDATPPEEPEVPTATKRAQARFDVTKDRAAAGRAAKLSGDYARALAGGRAAKAAAIAALLEQEYGVTQAKLDEFLASGT